MAGKKVWEKVRKILIGMLFGAMALQILFGVLWLCANIGTGQLFLVSEEYVANAKELRFDEYSGILYVILVALALGIEGIFGLPYYIFLSLVQLAAAFVSGCCFFRYVRKGRQKLFDFGNSIGSLYLMTIPMLLQSHLAVRAESLTQMLFLVMLGLCVKQEEENGVKHVAKMAALWAVTGLLDSGYLALGLLPMAVLCIRLIRKKSFGIKGAAVLVVMAVLLITVTGAAEPAENKIQRTLSASAVSRLVWPWFDQSYYFWPEEIKNVMSEEVAYEISLEPENVIRVFGSLVEQAYGRDKAGELYLSMAKSSLDVRTKEVLEGIWTDFKAYLCAPVSLLRQLEGKGSYSYSGFNYKVMSQEAPILTKYYVQFSLIGMNLALFGGLVLAVATAISNIRKKKRTVEKSVFLIVAVLVILTQSAWFALAGAGMMDYLNVSVLTILWYLIPIWILKNLIKSDV